MNDIQIDEKKYQLTEVPDLSVACQMDYERVISFRNVAVERRKLIEETFNPIVEKAHAAHKQAVQTRSLFLDKVVGIINQIDSNVRAYKRECERKAQEAQDKLRREAEAKAIAEKARLEAKAEKAIEKGNEAKAEELLEKAEQVETIVPTVAPVFEKVKGDTTRKTYRAEVTDFKSLPDEYKLPNVQLLNSIARSTKGTMKINGVKFICE